MVSRSGAVLQFSQIILILFGAFITIAHRLFAPLAIALAIDRDLAQRISHPFAWNAAVFTMVTPLVSHILGYIVYEVGDIALTIIKRSGMKAVRLDQASQIVSTLSAAQRWQCLSVII